MPKCELKMNEDGLKQSASWQSLYTHRCTFCSMLSIKRTVQLLLYLQFTTCSCVFHLPNWFRAKLILLSEEILIRNTGLMWFWSMICSRVSIVSVQVNDCLIPCNIISNAAVCNWAVVSLMDSCRSTTTREFPQCLPVLYTVDDMIA